jgi:hypothetical protein
MKNKIKSFITSSGIISALIGAIITGCISWYLLSKQIQGAKNDEIRKNRITLIKDTEYLFAQAPVIEAMFLESLDNSPNFMINKPLPIIKPSSLYIIKLHEGMKDAYVFHAQYKSLSRLIPIYFCHESTSKILKLRPHDDWWLSDYADFRDDILNSMYQEIECKK